MIDHCIAALKKENEDKLLRVYLTDMAKDIVDGLCALGGVESDMPRWYDLIDADAGPQEPQKSSEEIISSIKDKLRLYGGEQDGVDAV